jgi:hypothetical protein
MVKLVRGDMLLPSEQKRALAKHPYRYTSQNMKGAFGREYFKPPRFKTDRSWLRHNYFFVGENGKIDGRFKQTRKTRHG